MYMAKMRAQWYKKKRPIPMHPVIKSVAYRDFLEILKIRQAANNIIPKVKEQIGKYAMNV